MLIKGYPHLPFLPTTTPRTYRPLKYLTTLYNWQDQVSDSSYLFYVKSLAGRDCVVLNTARTVGRPATTGKLYLVQVQLDV